MLRASSVRVPFFGTQAYHISRSSTYISFNFSAIGTHFRTIYCHGADNLNLIYNFLFFMLCLCFNFCNMCECFYFSRVRNIYFIDIKMYKLILFFLFFCVCFPTSEKNRIESTIQLKTNTKKDRN